MPLFTIFIRKVSLLVENEVHAMFRDKLINLILALTVAFALTSVIRQGYGLAALITVYSLDLKIAQIVKASHILDRRL